MVMAAEEKQDVGVRPEAARSFFSVLEGYSPEFEGPDGRWYGDLDDIEVDGRGATAVPEQAFIEYRADVDLPEQDPDHKYEPQMDENDVTGRIYVTTYYDGGQVFEAKVSYPLYLSRREIDDVLSGIQVPDEPGGEDIAVYLEGREPCLRYEMPRDLDVPGGAEEAARDTLRTAQEIIDGFARRKVEEFFDHPTQEAGR